MHTLFVIVGIHAVLLGFAFALAGYMSLVSPDEHELSEFRAQIQAVTQKKGWLQAQMYAWRWQRHFRSLSHTISNWQQRPQARRLLYIGAGFLAIAAAVGYTLGAFSSPPLSPDEAMVVGKWRCNTPNGALRLYVFSRDHRVMIRYLAVDSFGHRSRAAMFGTWKVDGADVVYIVDRGDIGPAERTTTHIPISELRQAVRAGADPNARWDRL